MIGKNKVIVTGGAGFIGSNLAEELVKRGYGVTVIDDLSTGRMENLGQLLSKSNLEFVKGSITDLELLTKLFRNSYYVFHQAALASVPRSIDDPLNSHRVNLTGTLNVLLAARDNGVKGVIYASSSSVYGDTPTLPKSEDMTPRPCSPYAVTKLAAEHYCQVFSSTYGLVTTCLRYFNVYGAGQDPNSQYAAVVPRFIKDVSEGRPPIIFGDGEQTRDFTFIEDTVTANILAAEANVGGVYNIGSGGRVTINDLANSITGIIGNNLKPIHQEPRSGDIRHSLADISKAKLFGYEPKYDLLQGIKATIKATQLNN
ncbi:SDR family oxidoreductase [Chloroflexota bacterium]